MVFWRIVLSPMSSVGISNATRQGHTYAEGATYHPNERALELSREDLMKLPSALASFNGFYASHENYSITHPMHNLLALLVVACALLSVVILMVYRFVRRRRD